MESLKEIYKYLCNRKHLLLDIIGNTNMTYYTPETMKAIDLVNIYNMLKEPLLDDDKLYWVTYELKIWEKYKAHLELSFLTAQINYISTKLNDN